MNAAVKKMNPLGIGSSLTASVPFCSTSLIYRANSRIVDIVERLSLIALRTALERIGIRRTGVRSRDEIALIRHRIEDHVRELSSTMAIDFAKIPTVEYITWTVQKPLTSKEVQEQFPGVQFDS